MDFKQVYELVNQATNEVLGETAILKEDLTNVVDIGDAIDNARAFDGYVRSLVNHIGKCIFVNRVYRGSVPSILMDGWEYGSILEKINCELPEAQENESWELTDGAEYNPNIFKAPKVEAKFYNKRVTFEIQMSFAEKQVKQSFSNAGQLNAFVSMIYTAVENALTIKIDSLIMKTINNLTGETYNDEDAGSGYGASSGIRAVNLLYLYNQKFSQSLTADECLTDKDFIRFASYTIGLYKDRLSKMSTLFNIGGKERFTPADSLHLVLLSDFDRSAKVYLYDANGQLKDGNLQLPSAEIVPYWQGSGTSYAFGDVSKVYAKTSDNHDVEITGILGVMFDHNALGVTNIDRRVTTNYNPKGEFYNNYYKFDAGYFNDFNENFVVFFVEDAT